MPLFNHFSLETPESVELEFTLAGIGNRAYALLIDYLVLGLFLILLMLLWGLLYYFLWEVLQLHQIVGGDRLSQWLLAMQLLLVFSCFVGYFVFFETLWQGQTPGKRYLKTRVIRDNGRPIGLTQATLRALLRPLDDWFYIGMMLIIFTRQEKRLGDWVAGTLVIQEKPEHHRHIALQITGDRQALAQNLQTTTMLQQLTPEDFAKIRAYLERRRELLPPARQRLSQQLAQPLQTQLAQEDLKIDIPAEALLEAVYFAYQQGEHRPKN